MVLYKAIRNTPIYNYIGGQMILPMPAALFGTGSEPVQGYEGTTLVNNTRYVRLTTNYNGYPSYLLASDVRRYYNTVSNYSNSATVRAINHLFFLPR